MAVSKISKDYVSKDYTDTLEISTLQGGAFGRNVSLQGYKPVSAAVTNVAGDIGGESILLSPVIYSVTETMYFSWVSKAATVYITVSYTILYKRI